LEPHAEVSTRAGRRYAKTGEGDEIIGVQPVGEKDLLAVLTEKTNALVCKVAEVNELAGPGKGVTVIKVDEGDRVVDFLAAAPGHKDVKLEFETQKGRKLHLSPAKYEVVGRGGKGYEMSKRDAVKEVARPVTFIPLPEKKE
jgi:DNA gyrase subunit A